MALIAMNREMGSLGKDVAQELGKALGVKVQHHEIIDQLANRTRMRKSHVVSFLEGTQGLLERLTADDVSLRILTADEIMTLADSDKGVILRGWGATSLLKEVPHATRVCVTASRRVRVKRMMARLETEDEQQVERIVSQNDEASRAVMRRHFHIDPADVTEYDLALNTDRLSVEQCVDEILRVVKAEQFAQTEQSRRKLRDVAVMHHVRAALRTHASTAHCMVRVTAQDGQIVLEGVVENADERDACSDIAGRLKGVARVENRLRMAEIPARLRG